MSKTKTKTKSKQRFVNVFSTAQAGKFTFEFRELTKDSIRTVALIESASWEAVAPAAAKFMHGGNFDMSEALF